MKKLVALLLMLAMLVCAITPAAAEAADPLGKYDSTIELHFARSIDDDLQDNVIPSTPGEDLESNRWLTHYENTLGIKVVYDWIVKLGDAYTQKSNLAIVSGDLPDVMTVTAAQMVQLAENDLIYDMSELWDTYASDLTKEYYTMQGEAVLNAAKVDGKLMAVPASTSPFGDGYFIWIRQDWMDKLGLKAPETISDVLAICEAFTTQDPDGNGENDTYGLSICKELYNGFADIQAFSAAYSAFPNMWVEDASGNLVYGSTLPEMKQALQVLATMYANGQIDPEFGVKDGGKAAETIVSNKVGVTYGVQWNPIYPFLSNYLSAPETVDWVGYGLVSNSDKVYCPQSFGASDFYVVSKDCEHPEALIKMINLYFETNWGETNQFDYYYMPQENNATSVWKFSPVTPEQPLKNLSAFKTLQEARANGTVSELTGEAASIQGNIDAFYNGDSSFWGWMKIYGENGVFTNSLKYEANGEFFYEKFAGAPTETMVERKSSLKDLELESFIKIIMGSSPIDSFDEFVTSWYALGGQQITDEVNAWYASTK
jgi:putative aldouronate transport system substrate-binding protein